MKSKSLRRTVGIGLILVAVLVGIALSYTQRDTTPPQVYIEVPEIVSAELPFDLALSADEPVTYHVRYGDITVTEVAQSYSLSLMGQGGTVPLEISATDGANNESTYSYTVTGVAKLEPTVTAPSELLPGEPWSVSVGWSPETPPSSLDVGVGGERKTVFMLDGKAVALGGIPLGSAPGALDIHVGATDAYGRLSVVDEKITILPDPRPVQDLDLPASILSVSTPEGKALEKTVMDAAYGRANEFPAPQWTEPFVLPIEGRGTSGFGSPRRYAAGGNVSYHYGEDIAAPAGTPVAATNVGRVLVADFYPIKGGLVVIDHGASVYSVYMHQSKLLVEVGDMVARGQIIGEVGTTGLSSGPHLHWEMRVGAVATDPLRWVEKVLP